MPSSSRPLLSVFRPQDIEREAPPDRVVDSVADLPELLLS
jgi:hypothetical protein